MSNPIQIDAEGNLILKVNWKRMLKVALILAAAVSSYFLPIEGLTYASRITMMIFIGAAGFWVTEAIPPFATAIMVVVLNIYLLGQPGGALGLGTSGLETSYRIFLNPIASPTIVLFFGGFIMAIAATKHGLDLRLAKAFLRPFGTRPNMGLLGGILTTALFSMFMSNTATTAMMFAIFSPLFKHFEERDAFKKALILAIPFSANIGGMGTIIGTPPNAVAASVLNQLGYQITFFKWMVLGVPVMLVMLAVLWFLLINMFKPKKKEFEILFPDTLAMTWDLLTVTITFSVTVLLWISEPLHHIPAAVVALLPVTIFAMFGIINRDDLKKVEWDVLILVAGGLTLGVVMKSSGLSDILVGKVSFENLSTVLILAAVILLTILISNFMSNTSAANLLIPIVTSISVIFPAMGAIVVAFAASLAMSLPISTPPNAIAFATRTVNTIEMARAGSIVSAIGLIVLVAMVWIFQQFPGFF